MFSQPLKVHKSQYTPKLPLKVREQRVAEWINVSVRVVTRSARARVSSRPTWITSVGEVHSATLLCLRRSDCDTLNKRNSSVDSIAVCAHTPTTVSPFEQYIQIATAFVSTMQLQVNPRPTPPSCVN